MYEQLDIDGNWIKFDDNGNPCPEYQYKVIIKTKNHTFVFIITTHSYVDDVEGILPEKLAMVEERANEKAKSIEVYNAPVQYGDAEFRLCATYKRLKKFRIIK